MSAPILRLREALPFGFERAQRAIVMYREAYREVAEYEAQRRYASECSERRRNGETERGE